MKKFVSVFKTKSPLGVIYAIAIVKGICEIKINQKPQRNIVSQNRHLKHFCDWLKRYLRGGENMFNGALDLSWANDFDKIVYRELLKVKYGCLTTYAKMAKAIGKPDAARAVGNSLAKNKLPIVIPCHRVVSSDGSIGGYSGGLKVKKFLLQLEKDI